jgi:selenocysteine lyase/cysteine desulfurase
MAWHNELRSQFPVTGLCTYLDSAYDCGGSLIGKAAANRYFEDWAQAAATAKRGGPGREPFFKIADETREYIAELLGGVSPKNVTITKNTNEGFNIIMQGFAFQPGDNIVIFDREHSAIVAPCVNAAKSRGVNCKFAEMDSEFNPSIETLWEQVDDRTVMVFVSHVQSLTGCKIDLKELGGRCREKGIFLIVDAIQSVGLSSFRAQEWGVSAVSGGGYKGLGAFISIGYLYCCDALLEKVKPTFVANNYEKLILKYSNNIPELCCLDPLDASKFDNRSSDYLGTYVFHDSLKAILEVGTANIERHITALLSKLYEGLQQLGYNLITPEAAEKRCASLCMKTTHAKEIYQYFLDHNVISSCSGGQYIRMSLGAYNNEDDIDRALKAAADCPWR